jgi:GalNAc-alpha-(1->4)-GalNAc-alpha-(1->3)-diNAcBac-PP-undecaprenol alpha-1,4-N-acetyl-D-galactosaminyltransferase
VVHNRDLAPRVCPPVKCLFVINDLARAGAEKQAVLLACGLKALGWSVSVVLIKQRNDFAEQLAGAAIPVTALHRRGPRDLGVVRRLRMAMVEESPDVVISFLFMANLLTILSSPRLKPAPRIVLSVRGPYCYDLTGIQRLVARVAHQYADLIVFNSMSALQDEQRAFPSVSRVAHLPNAVVTTRVTPFDWSTLGVSGGRVVVSVGQLVARKGHSMLIEAFIAVRKTYPDAHLVLVGDGPEEERLRTLAEMRGVGNRVAFPGHQQDPLPLIAAADVFVQASFSEGMSNAIMEAMSLGRCIVATRVGAASDLLEDGVHGLLCAPTTQDLAHALDRTLADSALRERLGRAARTRAEAFSVDRIASELDAILRRLLSSPPPP